MLRLIFLLKKIIEASSYFKFLKRNLPDLFKKFKDSDLQPKFIVVAFSFVSYFFLACLILFALGFFPFLVWLELVVACTVIAAFFVYTARFFKSLPSLESFSILIGALVGMGLAITLIVFGYPIAFVATFSYFAYVLFVLGYTCAVAGLVNRVACCIKSNRLPQEKKAMCYGLGLGVVLAVLIIFCSMTGVLPFVSLVIVSKSFFDLLALNKVLLCIGIFLGITSTSISLFDYLSKAYCFKFLLGTKYDLEKRIESRKYEYQGAYKGVRVGSLVVVVISVMVVFLMGFLPVPSIAWVPTILLITMISINTIAAFFSRTGHGVDVLKGALKREDTANEAIENEGRLVNSGELQAETPALPCGSFSPTVSGATTFVEASPSPTATPAPAPAPAPRLSSSL